MWCLSGINSYNIQRIEHENTEPVDLEIEFYPNYDAKQIIEAVRKSREGNEKMVFDWGFEGKDYTSPPPPVGTDDVSPLDSWSVVWYIASFGGLIAFFLIVSCSEWCCRKAVRNSQNCSRTPTIPPTPTTTDTPPPSYDEFAPPSYESICLGRSRGEKSEYDIYVVPVHALGSIMQTSREVEDAPPSYQSASRPSQNSVTWDFFVNKKTMEVYCAIRDAIN